MTSPARRHRQRVLARKAAAAANAGQSMAGSSEYELMLAKLHQDRRRLSAIQSLERKIEVKRELLPDYNDWIAGVLAGGKGAQDNVLTTLMVWHVDVGNYEQALAIGAYVLRHGLVLPDQYERTPATVLVDEIADAALNAQADGTPFSLDVLLNLHELTEEQDMPDQARAKLHRALGNACRAEVHPIEAVRDGGNPLMKDINMNYLVEAAKHYERALQLHARVGCKRDLTEVQKQLEQTKQEAPASD